MFNGWPPLNMAIYPRTASGVAFGDTLHWRTSLEAKALGKKATGYRY